MTVRALRYRIERIAGAGAEPLSTKPKTPGPSGPGVFRCRGAAGDDQAPPAPVRLARSMMVVIAGAPSSG